MPTPISQDAKKSLQDKIQQCDTLSHEEKSTLYGLLSERKRYGLVWEDKPEQAYEQLRTQIPVFTEVPERRIMGSSADAPNHILIEGDNLHALTAMQYTHAGKVDVIYIDPPYNTGNKDFSYNDTFVDKEDKVKFFSLGPDRVFIRNRAILGRDVRMCHPPSSVHIVEQILADFKSGKESSAAFWISMQGKFIYIAYFALRGKEGEYLGTIEFTQDLTKLRQLEGEQRLLSYSGR